MARIIMATWDGGGNVPPTIAIAEELRRRGHDLLVIGHAGNRRAARRAGLSFECYATARHFVGSVVNSPLTLLNSLCDRAMGADVADAVRRFGADLVVVDCLLPAVLDRLVADGVRFVMLEHMFDGFLRDALMRGPYGIGLRLKGFRYTQLSDGAQRCIVATLPDLDPGSGRARANVVFTGPTCTGISSTPRSEPTILVSLSTFGYAGMAKVYQRIIDAVATLPVHAIVTTGGLVDAAALRPAANVELCGYVPHAELLSQTSLVVGHGGHSTTMIALAHDIPLLIIPMQSKVDQPMVGAAIQAAGAGRTMSRRSTSGAIRAAVEQLLADPIARENAARLGQTIRDGDGARAATTEIEKVLT
ncbi:glycosyltransferase family 1 protein [Gordonia sp. TBRC 11910]|uniref:Glycosyltransferase family 1 protein n=1 Tax=Gordonia asplenii TaxID=2725283 RepID=A0A848KVL2_9ACTN|nr:glycosyltransferase [Gordonia asplenii]NMO02302.1 glycosyltransferase family 1 protein [Gordonia asplenii]